MSGSHTCTPLSPSIKQSKVCSSPTQLSRELRTHVSDTYLQDRIVMVHNYHRPLCDVRVSTFDVWVLTIGVVAAIT